MFEPALLSVLAEQPAHGYDLSRAIVEITGGFLRVDRGRTYRLLRRLEQEGAVTSSWTDGEFGPQRREYRLTSEGRAMLAGWHEPLEVRERAFRSVRRAIDRCAGPAQGGTRARS